MKTNQTNPSSSTADNEISTGEKSKAFSAAANSLGTTAAAASAALFALQHCADAAVIYSGPNQNITAAFGGNIGQARATFALSAGAKMVIAVGRTSGNFFYNGAALVGHTSANPVGFLLNGSANLKKLAGGANISAAQFAGHLANDCDLAFRTSGGAGGTWASNQTGVGAFKMNNGDLGWVRLKWSTRISGAPADSITAIDWAYNNVPGQSISAGQTVPEPGTTALLALAGAGGALAQYRRRKKQQREENEAVAL